MASVRPWPKVPEEDHWIIELMEERFGRTSQSPQQLRARAKELYAEAEQAEIGGHRDALLALADRYEQAAAARLTGSLKPVSQTGELASPREAPRHLHPSATPTPA